MKNTWKHGIAQVRLYDPYAPGDVSRYLSKRRFSSAADCEGANTYELRKFKSGGLDLYQVQPPGAEMRHPERWPWECCRFRRKPNISESASRGKMQTAEHRAVVGSPDLESLTTSHVERAFLTVRQELKRFERKGLGYSKSLEMHKLAVALHFGVYIGYGSARQPSCASADDRRE